MHIKFFTKTKCFAMHMMTCLVLGFKTPGVLQAGYPKNTRPTYTPSTSRTNPSPSCPGCLVPCPNLDSKPPLLSPVLSAVQGPAPSPPLISRSGKSQIHDKRATSLPCAHTQVCARDNKSVTCPRCLMQRPVLN